MKESKVPPAILKGFSIADSLSDHQLRAVSEVLRNSQIGADFDDIVKEVEQAGGLNSNDARSILVMFIGILGLKDQFESSPDKMVSAIIRDISEDAEIANIQNDAALRDTFVELVDSSGARAIRLTQKAYELLIERNNILRSSKVILDMRPVFGGKDNESVEAMTLLYNLKIAHYKTGSFDDPTTTIFALDEDDLKKLKESIVRSEIKAEAIKAQFREVPFISPK